MDRGLNFFFHGALHPQKPYGLSGTGEEWTNKRMNKRTNEQKNEQTNEWKVYWTRLSAHVKQGGGGGGGHFFVHKQP